MVGLSERAYEIAVTISRGGTLIKVEAGEKYPRPGFELASLKSAYRKSLDMREINLKELEQICSNSKIEVRVDNYLKEITR